MQVQVTITTDEDKNDPSIPVFDFTKLSALNMCPRWGLIRYDQHKRMPGEGRSTALEMGSAAHDGFAAIRLFELLEYAGALPDLPDGWFEAIRSKGLDLFGPSRFEQICDIIGSADDQRRRVNAVAIHAVNTSGYYDDPSDRRRTLSNLEASLIGYIDRLELGRKIPVIKDGLVGIEVPFDVTLDYTSHVADCVYAEGWENPTRIRYIGRIDGLVQDQSTGRLEIDENKTASRLDKSWQDAFLTSHQVTGYCVAASAILDKPVRHANVRGMMVPLPKTYDLGGIVNMAVSRDEDRINEWYRWVWHTYTALYLPHRDDPLFAPEYTHSCNRYFRSCSFIPLCAMASREDRELSFSQMEHDEWSPLAERDK